MPLGLHLGQIDALAAAIAAIDAEVEREADLGEDDLGRQVTDAGDGDELADRFAERAEVAASTPVSI